METKTCNICKINKPLEEFYLAVVNKDGYKNYCKNCASEQTKAYRARNKDKLSMRRRESYQAYWTKNKEKILMRQRESYYENHDEQLDKARQYYLQNKDKVGKTKRKYRTENREALNLYVSRRNSIKRQLKADLTLEQWETIKRIFSYRCVYCGKKTKRLEKDHVIPLTKGGELTLHNIVPACRACNCKKSNNLPTIPVKLVLL